jgi:hypothetical protein
MVTVGDSPKRGPAPVVTYDPGTVKAEDQGGEGIIGELILFVVMNEFRLNGV